MPEPAAPRTVVVWAGPTAVHAHLKPVGLVGAQVVATAIPTLMAVSARGGRLLAEGSGLAPDESVLDIADILDAPHAWRDAEPLPSLDVRSAPPRAGPLRVPELPKAAALFHRVSREVVSRLPPGAGVLVLPAAWEASEYAQNLLDPWAAAGWRFVGWQTGVSRSLKGRRMMYPAGAWVRVLEAAGELLLPASPEASFAARAANAVLRQIIELLAPDIRTMFLDDGLPRWFTEAQLRARIAGALRDRAGEIILGGSEAPIFATSTGVDSSVGEHLGALRFRLQLPTLPTGGWWARLGRPGAFRSPTGSIRIQGIDWSGMPTFIANVGGDAERVQFSMEMEATHAALEAPVAAGMFDEPGRPIARAAALPENEVRFSGGRAGVPRSTTVRPDGDGSDAGLDDVGGPPSASPTAGKPLAALLATHRPDTFALSRAHRCPVVLIDGTTTRGHLQPISGEIGAAGTAYRVDDARVNGRSVVRVDYEAAAPVAAWGEA